MTHPEIFYAHSVKDQSEEAWQRLVDHLAGASELAATFAQSFGLAELGRAAGLLHDLGKYTVEFQQRLHGGRRVDHATWGAKVAIERYPRLGPLLAYAIAGHHAGLANGRDGEQRTSLNARLGADLPLLDARWQQEVLPPSAADLMQELSGLKPHRERQFFQHSMLVRMLFSCLVDADYLDTEAFYALAEPSRAPRQPPVTALGELRDALDQYLSGLQANADDSAVNRQRTHVLSHVRAGAVQPPGLFSLTVPTGGGKTLASLAFALDHALTHGLRRVIYVIPFTSIVEQTAAVFRKALGEQGKTAVLEHHSAFVDDHSQSPEAKDKLKQAMENWDAPIVVTTAVQFFESLFADRPSRCRKLHNIAGSVVILDEAQTLPLPLLKPSVAALDELARNYRASIVLCTATQPVLEAPKLKGGLAAGSVRELAPEPQALYQALRRVRVRHVGTLDDVMLIERLCQREQVLCIVNNRRHARALYQAIAGQLGACHLSTLMCAAHRRTVLADARKRLKQGAPCRLVSTSLIEAGVDVDFPSVLRAEAGLDAIAQAAGRCNREGRWPLESSVLEVFASDNPDWVPPAVLRQHAQAAARVMRRYPDDVIALPAISAYFDELYWQKGDDALDKYALLSLIESGKLEGLPFETLASRYRLIDDASLPVIIPYQDPQEGHDAPALLRALEHAEHCGQLARQLQPYIVNLPRHAYDALRGASAIQPVNSLHFGEQFMQLANPSLYHPQFGLQWDNPEFIEVEKTMW